MKSLYSARALALLDDLFQKAQSNDGQPHISSQPELGKAATTRPTLVSLPLIVTTGHAWSMYFACDRDTSIDIHGALPNGFYGFYLGSVYAAMLAPSLDDMDRNNFL